MRITIFATAAFALLAAPLAAQVEPSHRSSRAVVDPFELSGPPKKPVPVSPTKRAFVQSGVFDKANSKDQSVLASAAKEITTYIQQDPTDTDIYFMRATVSCEITGGSKEAMLADINTSIKLWKPDAGSAFESLTGHYATKAKIEFLLGRYGDALDDLAAGMRINYAHADDMFNNGNVKPDEPISMPCMWSQADVNKLADLFPKDYRTALYVGLYRSEFSKWSSETDFQPALDAFEHAAEINPSSPLPFYFSARPYIVGGIGGITSTANATCVGGVVPRTKPCLDLDELHRTGVRLLTKAIASDPRFQPAYAVRAEAHRQLHEYRQAIRDYTKALELDPKANLYGDRGLEEVELKEYQAAILDFTKRIAQGCESFPCEAYENRADVYLKLHDYPHAVSDLDHAVRNKLGEIIFLLNIDQFRRIYPEYDSVADDVLCEKLRGLFYPEMSYADYSKHFLIDANEWYDFILPELYLKRGDAYGDMGDTIRANRDYARVAAGFPKVAEDSFTTRNGKRVRVRE